MNEPLTCGQVLDTPTWQGLLVAHAVLMRQPAIHYVGEYLRIAMGVLPAGQAPRDQ